MSQVRAFSRRLKLPKSVEEKADEYHRLSEVKCSSAMKSEPCLTLVCIEIACGKLGEPVDKKQIQRLSGMQPKAYISSYQMVEKLLNLSTKVSVKDLAVRFGCFEAKELAGELMSRYKGHVESKYTASQKEAIDLNKPLYPAAALYCACKLLKIRCDKNNYLTAALSPRAVFQSVLDEITQCAPKNIEDFKGRNRKHGKEPAIENDDNSGQSGPSNSTLSSRLKVLKRDSFHCRIQSDPTAEDYLKWRETILKEANKELEEQPV